MVKTIIFCCPRGRTWQEAWLWLECSPLSSPFLSYLFMPFLFLQKTFAELHLCPLLSFHGWRKQSLKISTWYDGHSALIQEPWGCRITCLECVARGFPLSPDVWEGVHPTSFHSAPPPEGPHYSQQCHKPGTRLLTSKPFRFLGLNHNGQLPTCLSRVQVHIHCLPSEALWLFFLCLWVTFGRLNKDKSSGPAPVFLGRGCRHPPCCSTCEDLVRGRLWCYMATYITFMIG